MNDIDVIDEGFSENSGISLLEINPRAKFVIISLVILLVSRILMTVFEHIQFNNYQDYFAGDYSAAERSENMVNLILSSAGLYLVALITVIIAVCVWFYRANQNIHRANLENIEYTSGWAAGWFFVPFANLVKPANVMSEILKGTNKISGKYNKTAWKAQQTSSLVIIWWLCYILSGFVSNISSRMFDEVNLQANDYALISNLEYISIILSITSAVMLIKLITDITSNQEKVRQEEVLI